MSTFTTRSLWPDVSGTQALWLLVPLLLGYLLSVRVLRHRNLRELQRKYARYLDDPYSMDYKTAHAILKTTMLREFPFLFGFGTQWALVKSYGIASGTKLLVQTRRLTSEKTVGKRSEDTGVFLGEFLVSGIDSERGLRALSKMNWIHRQYGSRIGNGELIHTLALFILEPQRWIDRYEWRELSQLEKVAGFLYYKEIGNRMGMEDLPQTLEDLVIWAQAFEAENMVYADSNRACTVATLNLFSRGLPRFLQGLAHQIFAAFLEDSVRPVVGIEDPPVWILLLVRWTFTLRSLAIKHLFLPRFRDVDAAAKEGVDGRLHRESYLFEPWYVRETVWTRLLRWLSITSKPLPGPEYQSAGYLPEELGPSEYEKSSKDAVLKQAIEMQQYAQQGGGAVLACPFAFARR